MSRIAVVLKGYPRLSETFIAQEILGLERRGIDQLIVSLRKPYDPFCHDMHREIRADILYLPEYLKDDPKRVRAGRRLAQALPGHEAARAVFDRDLKRDRTVNRWRRWGQACVLARELPDDVTHLHSHFLHTPASVTRYAAKLRGLTWSFSAHAKDIWTSPDWELAEKIADARWGATCTGVNADHLRQIGNCATPVDLIHHGLDLTRFPPPKATYSGADGRGTEPVRLLSVGRAVEKKGYDDLLAALAMLPAEINWTFTHIGGGGLLKKLKMQADRLEMASRITWLGALPRPDVIDACLTADLFVLPSKITKSGDRDGIPNVLMEAAALGLPVISTRVSAIPELVVDGKTGLLVAPRDRAALAEAIESLIRSPKRREDLGRRAADLLKRDFSCEPGIDRVAERLRQWL